MDLGAYAQIDDLGAIAKENGIYVPRLRGYRLMMNERPVTDGEIMDHALWCALSTCDNIVRTGSEYVWANSKRAFKRVKRYLITEKIGYSVDAKGINWNTVHGKLRKRLKFEVKKSQKAAMRQWDTWNRYCGKNVLYIHARIGGGNWSYYCDQVKDQPWFIEKVDDAYDSTYCDIYARLK